MTGRATLAPAPWSISSEPFVDGLVLFNGAPATIRTLRDDDEPRVARLIERASARTLQFRFFGAIDTMPEDELHRFVCVDPDSTLAMAITIGADDDEQIIGMCRLIMDWDAMDGEVAFFIEDPYQHQGLGQRLFGKMLDAARAARARTISCETLMANKAMRRLFHDCATGPVTTYLDPPVLMMSFTLEQR